MSQGANVSESKKDVLTVGWREWVSFPELDNCSVKAKVDTGARSSALHAEEIEILHRRGSGRVRFKVFPLQRSKDSAVQCEAALHDERWVKSSNGKKELRPVIRTSVSWGGQQWEIDLTLTSRDLMGFRMLLGREAVRGRFLVNPGKSFLGGRPKKKGKKSAKHTKGHLPLSKGHLT